MITASVIKSITITVFFSMLFVMLMGPVVLPALKKFKFGQTVRDDGPESHLKKNGTPTMGGIMIIISIAIVTIFRANMTPTMWMMILCMFGFGMVGFLDDFIKIKMKRSLGLTPMQKIILQVVLSFLISWYSYRLSIGNSQFILPFAKIGFSIGIFYIPVMMIIIIGTVNAVNLTDGLDGLASGITAIVSIFFILFALLVTGNMGISVFAATILGSCLGFLWFNVNPARVFMGDTGSMALGGAVVACAVFTNSVLVIPIVGGIYLAEALSVIIQVTYFKKTKKRIFKMAPLHHHYEKCGWPETKVVFIFWLVAAILTIIGIISML